MGDQLPEPLFLRLKRLERNKEIGGTFPDAIYQQFPFSSAFRGD